MTVSKVLYSSDKMDWGTPQAFFDLLDAEFHFTVDAAASHENAKCGMYYTKEIDALRDGSNWPGVVWCNPPYGREIAAWLAKAYYEARKGSTVVVLIPSRTDTRYWHTWVMRAAEIRFVAGRLQFEGSPGAAPFPSVVVVFRPGHEGPPVVSAIERGR